MLITRHPCTGWKIRELCELCSRCEAYGFARYVVLYHGIEYFQKLESKLELSLFSGFAVPLY